MCNKGLLKEGAIIWSDLEMAKLINNPGLPCQVFIDMEKRRVEVLEEGQEVKNNWIKLPIMEDLYPYNKAVGDYVADYDIPHKMSASTFLKKRGLMSDFYSFREKEAVRRLEQWLLERECLILENVALETNDLNALLKQELYERYTFDRFVVGECNQKAYDLCTQVANDKYKRNALILQGVQGIGKEHLLQATIWSKLERNPDCQVEFVKDNSFDQELEKSVTGWNMDTRILSLIDKYQVTDLLVICNFDRLINNRISRYILEKVISYRIENARPMLLSSESLPNEEIECDIFRLLVENAEVVNVSVPDCEMRERIVRYWITNEGYEEYFDEELIKKVVQEGYENIRILQGHTLKVVAEKKLVQVDAEANQVMDHLANCIWIFK